MSYLAAGIAVALHIDPMAVLDWPPDILQAVVDTMNRDTPADHERQFNELMAFAQSHGR